MFDELCRRLVMIFRFGFKGSGGIDVIQDGKVIVRINGISQNRYVVKVSVLIAAAAHQSIGAGEDGAGQAGFL